MRFPINLPTAGALLRWGGLFTVVLAIIGGLLGMHVVNGAPEVSTQPSGMIATVMPQGISEPSSTPANLAAETGHSPSAAALEQVGAGLECGCSPTDCDTSMAMHGHCTPTISSTLLTVPLPGTLSTHAPGTAFAVLPGHKAADRAPDPPSLEKLSISRT